ncbi:hypothetical protein [Limnohabitans sp. 2KL-1]|nr:hypothetical protein [Limnohabitans sp. 2KL-1]
MNQDSTPEGEPRRALLHWPWKNQGLSVHTRLAVLTLIGVSLIKA